MIAFARRACCLTWGALLLGCHRPDSRVQADIARVALRALFLEREHATAVTLWRDTTTSLTLASLSVPDASPALLLDSATLGLTIARRVATLDTMEAFFRQHAAGWDAWFEANPGNAGLVEVARPIIRGTNASVVVGRACGEQCRSAWRVTMSRADSTWTVKRIEVLKVPRG